MGNYSSKITIDSFKKGLSIDECLSKYNDEYYLEKGYHKIWDKSALALKERDNNCDIGFAEEFLELTRKEHTMLTFNHPKISVLFSYLEKIFNLFGIVKDSTANIEYLSDPLLDAELLPIYHLQKNFIN